MPARLSAEQRGEIRGYYKKCQNIEEVVRVYKCSRNTVKAIIDGTRRSDMDSYRRKKKSKAHITERRTHLRRLAPQVTVQHYTAGVRRKPKVRILPKYPTCRAMREWFNENNKIRKAKKQREQRVPSISTINRDLKREFKNRVRPKVPYHREDVDRRRRFVSNPDFADPKFCKQIMFCDEHYVTTNDHSSRTMWVRNVRDLIPREFRSKHNTVSSQLWAMIGYNYKSPIIWVDFEVDVEDKNGRTSKKKITRMNQTVYINRVLKHRSVLPELKKRTRIFMQDGARCHQGKETKAFLKKHNIRYVEDWPAHSPDLNPIEQVWALINSRVAKKRCPADSVEDLRKMVEAEWEEITLSEINEYVMSFMTKCATCKRNKGGSAKK